jgi:hypothetical protein
MLCSIQMKLWPPSEIKFCQEDVDRYVEGIVKSLKDPKKTGCYYRNLSNVSQCKHWLWYDYDQLATNLDAQRYVAFCASAVP